MYNQGWPGHSQPEMAEIFNEILDHMPQVPVKKIINGVKSLISSPNHHHDYDGQCSEAMPSTSLATES
jgi:hypothetical protein